MIPSSIVFAAHHAELVFDPDEHRYKLKGGEVLSSVTQILKAEGIQQYGPANSNSDFRMQVGTWVHKAIEWYERGTLNEAELSEGVAAYLKSYKEFKRITKFVPILDLIEIPMWHSSWRFSGTPDLPGVIAERFVICDLKCGVKRHGDVIQIAGYGKLIANAVIGFEHLHPEGCIVYLDESGNTPKIERVKVEDMHANASVFIAALQLNRWKGSHGA